MGNGRLAAAWGGKLGLPSPKRFSIYVRARPFDCPSALTLRSYLVPNCLAENVRLRRMLLGGFPRYVSRISTRRSAGAE